MLYVVYEGVRIGVCAKPHRSDLSWFHTSYVLIDHETMERAGFKLPTPRGTEFIEQDPFDLTAEDGAVRYTGCTFYTYTAAYRPAKVPGSTIEYGPGGTIFENAVIQHTRISE